MGQSCDGGGKNMIQCVSDKLVLASPYFTALNLPELFL